MPSPSEANIFTVLGNFLQEIVPGLDIVKGQDNRVPEPEAEDFAVMWTIRRPRLSTNIQTWADVFFIGSIAGSTLTVTSLSFGIIEAGATLFGTGVEANTTITGQLSGSIGGTGVYSVSVPQQLPGCPLAAGAIDYLQKTEVVVQVDVHGPNSSDNAQTIATMFRDDYACEFFENSGFDVAPLYVDDPQQMPFVNAEQQYEWRWVIHAHLQANQAVSFPQQFFSEAVVGLIEVDEKYPP